MLTFEQIKELLELVSERGLGGLEIERAGFRLKIDGQPEEPVPPAPVPAASVTAAQPAAANPSAAPAPPAPAEETEAGDDDLSPAESAEAAGAHVVTSPIVGTFYAAASPDADPFVTPGSRVEQGQVLCIVEAMKIMNEIESDVAGEVLEVYPQNGQPVEFGEPLFAVRTG